MLFFWKIKRNNKVRNKGKYYKNNINKRNSKVKNKGVKNNKNKYKGLIQKINLNNGITLVALVITIVILIILATITINFAFGEGGLIQKAQQAKNLTEEATKKEQEALNSILDEYANIMAEESETIPTPEPDASIDFGDLTEEEKTQ